jgi:hypothetical protein
MSSDTRIERRPDAAGESSATFPVQWGEPPSNREERAAWIRSNIRRGQEQAARGEPVEWLAQR